MATDDGKVEELAIALVREYLSRKGYRTTLASLDNEAPRTEHSISNRSSLIRELGLDDLVKRNKALPRPFKTTLEITVNHFVTTANTKSLTTTPPTLKKDTPLADTFKPTPPKSTFKKDTPLNGNPITIKTSPKSGNPTKIRETSLTKRSHQFEEMAGVSGTHHELTKVQRVLQGMNNPLAKLHMKEEKIKGETTKWLSSEDKTERVLDSHKKNVVITKSSQTLEGSQQDAIIWEDLDDINSYIDDDATSLAVQSSVRSIVGEPISCSTAQQLREIVFGTATGPSFNEEWKSQGFVFNTIPSLSYGLVQYKGGPCGILACVQAYILKTLMKKQRMNSDSLQLSPSMQKELLVTALSEILWNAGEKERAVVALKPWQKQSVMASLKTKSYWPDQLTEQLMIHSFRDYTLLEQFISHHMSQFNSTNKGNAGCIVYLYSVILSRGLDRLQADFDEPSSTLIGAHGYCTQELINLFLTGAGVSNAFDGNMNIGSGEETSLLKGLKCQSDIGYLTLFEYYGTCKVGSFFKNPKFPIWVLCSESHFTVLFSLSMDPLIASVSKIQLQYYDGLCNFTEPIVLTIDTTAKAKVSSSDDPRPPLELCIMTKWNGLVTHCSHDGLFC